MFWWIYRKISILTASWSNRAVQKGSVFARSELHNLKGVLGKSFRKILQGYSQTQLSAVTDSG